MSSSTFLHQLVAQRTAFVEVKQELTDDIAASHQQQHADMLKDNDEHLCVVCMDNERSCLYVPCNHLVVCVECDADIKAASLPCPYCNEAIDLLPTMPSSRILLLAAWLSTCYATSSPPHDVPKLETEALKLKENQLCSMSHERLPILTKKKAVLERHKWVPTHGDVCRLPGDVNGQYFCPLGCRRTDGPTHCVLGEESEIKAGPGVPCRAKVREPPALKSRVRVLVKGLPITATEVFVRELFSSTGRLEDLEVHRKQRFASVAAVVYANHSGALKAVERFDGHQLDSGEVLKVIFATCGEVTRRATPIIGGSVVSPAAANVMHTFYFNPSPSPQAQDMEMIKAWKELWTQEGWCVCAIIDRSIDRSINRSIDR